LNIIYNLLT